MGTPRIVGLKTMNIALRRIRVDNGARVVMSQKDCNFATQAQRLPQNTEIPRQSDRSGGSGGGMKVVMALGVAAGVGAATYYYWNENKSDPFTWVNDQLPITKKKTETKLAVTETGGLKVKNNTNQVMAAPERTPEKTQILRSSQDSKSKSAQDIQAKTVQESVQAKSEQKTQEKTKQEVQEQKVEEVVHLTESQKSEEKTTAENSQPDSVAATALAELSNKVAAQASQVEELKQKYEAEIITALTRQAQVYHETIDHSKNVLRNEYERKLKLGSEVSEAEHMVELRAKYGQATAALAAMEQALRGRREQEIVSERSRKLWTYCNVLYRQINYKGEENSTTPKTVPASKESLLKEFSGNSMIVGLLKTLPDDVESTESLRVRFFNVVDSSCRKVALFKNGESITLWKYLLGSIQESLVTKCEGEIESASTPFEILDKTAFHLKRGELFDAVCVLNRIQGLPREICRDWLTDARTVLEANQSLIALMTHATANNNLI